MQFAPVRTLSLRSIRKGTFAALAAVLPLLIALPAVSATLDRVRESGKMTLGYEVDSRPFSYRDDAGKPGGYAVALCERVADAVKGELGLPELAVEWVP